jgi:hypothetical protein
MMPTLVGVLAAGLATFLARAAMGAGSEGFSLGAAGVGMLVGLAAGLATWAGTRRGTSAPRNR